MSLIGHHKGLERPSNIPQVTDMETEFPTESLLDKLISPNSTLTRGPRNTRNDYLFERAMLKQKMRMINQEKAKTRKEESQLQDCSFHPHINTDYPLDNKYNQSNRFSLELISKWNSTDIFTKTKLWQRQREKKLVENEVSLKPRALS